VSARIRPVDGLCNVRDLGGLRTRDGRVVRAGCVIRGDLPHWLTDAGVAELGPIGTVVDLRNATEVEHDAAGPLEAHGAVRHHVPFGHVGPAPDGPPPDREDGASIYAFLVEYGAGAILATLELLADAPLPLYVHCTAGKDRTGITVAFLLSLLGVGDQDITDDYMLTEQAIDEIVRRGRALPSAAVNPDDHPLGRSIDISYIQAVVAALAAAGGAESCLARWCAPPDLANRLRERLLTPA